MDFYRIECDATDPKRNHQVAAEAGEPLEKDLAWKIVTITSLLPNLSLAEIFTMIRTMRSSRTMLNGNRYMTYSPATKLAHHSIMYPDFSLLIAESSTTYRDTHTSMRSYNIFEFIDSKQYENYPEDHPIHKLIEDFRLIYGFEHMAWMGGTNPTTGKTRTDEAWLELVKAREQS